jgi:thiamine biosynthesis lipoprotein
MISVVNQKILLILSISIGFLSCNKRQESYSAVQGYAQGSTFRVVYKPISDRDYIEALDSILLVIDQSMSLWDSTSLIVRLNQSSEPMALDKHFSEVYRRSKYFHKISNGAFDPTLGPLIEAWGFARKQGFEFPSQGKIDSLKHLVDFNHFVLRKGILTKANPKAQLDFNGIAQGYTVDVLGRYLESQGITDYLVELGGETLGKGLNQFGQNWKVGIERPDWNNTSINNAVKTVVGLSNAALVTSGSYRKFIEKDGQKYSHTLDARTGKPVIHNLLSVTVITDNAMDADAFATMFMVIGKDSALNYADQKKILIQCIYEEQGLMKTAYSKGFEKLIIQEN